MDAHSPAVRRPRNSKPHSVAQIERETASNHLLDVLALSAQQGRARHAVHSVVCFHTKPCLCRLRSVSPSGGIIGCCAWSYSTLSGVVAAPPGPWVPPALHFHPVATELSHGTFEGGWKEWRAFSEVSVRTHVFGSLSYCWNQRRDFHDISCGQRSASEVFSYATLLSVTAEPVTFFIHMPAVVLQQHSFLHSSCWHIDSMHISGYRDSMLPFPLECSDSFSSSSSSFVSFGVYILELTMSHH